jgi:hypothetical protein
VLRAAFGGWVISWWEGRQLALALDATSLGTRFTVLAVSVLYRGCAIPVAWVILPANQKHAWRGEWLRLLHRLHRVVPRHTTVIVLADRGLYAPCLFRRIVRLGWHPALRINLGGWSASSGAARLCCGPRCSRTLPCRWDDSNPGPGRPAPRHLPGTARPVPASSHGSPEEPAMTGTAVTRINLPQKDSPDRFPGSEGGDGWVAPFPLRPQSSVLSPQS